MTPIQWHLKANWHVPESLEKTYSHSKIPSQASTVVVAGRKCPSRTTTPSTTACTSNLYASVLLKPTHNQRRVGCESCRDVEKMVQKCKVKKSLTGRHTSRQDVMTIQPRRRVGDVFHTISHRGSTKSPKPLTDKPHSKHTSRKCKQKSVRSRQD